jgi:hypothetical protein
MTPLWLELLKLALQLAGALFVAKRTVQWALNRYKFEKEWERQTSSVISTMTALGDMKASINVWMHDIARNVERNPDDEAKIYARYLEGKSKLEQMTAIAQLTLPEELAARILRIRRDVEKCAEGGDQFERLDSEGFCLSTAQNDIVGLARSLFIGLQVPPPEPFSDLVGWLRYRNKVRLSYADEKQE